MEVGDRIFAACILLGLCILFSLGVEQVALYFIPKWLRIGDRTKIIAGILGLGFLLYGLLRNGIPDDPQNMDYQQAGSALGLIFAFGLIGGFILVFTVQYFSKKIGAATLILSVVGFFAFSVLAYFVIRPLIPTEALTDNDIVFLCAAASLVMVLALNKVMQSAVADAPAPVQLKINPNVDSLSFGEKRRERLNKKRARR